MTIFLEASSRVVAVLRKNSSVRVANEPIVQGFSAITLNKGAKW